MVGRKKHKRGKRIPDTVVKLSYDWSGTISMQPDVGWSCGKQRRTGRVGGGPGRVSGADNLRVL